MKLSEIITSVQNLLQDDQFPTAQIIEAANWVQDDLLNNNNIQFMQESDVLNANAGDTTLDFPDDMRTVITMYVTSPAPAFDMQPRFMDYDEFTRRFADYTSNTASQIRNYTQFGPGIRFSAPLNTNVTIAIDYFRNPVPMKGLNDVCEIPDNYREIISRATLARCMEQNEDYSEAATERNNIAPLITTFIRRESVGQKRTGPVIMKSMRRRIGGRNSWSQW